MQKKLSIYYYKVVCGNGFTLSCTILANAYWPIFGPFG